MTTPPSFVYGTAWKEERTAGLVEMAIRAGFRAIDTANQRKHYCEAAVGEGIARAGLARAELFLQTKFTYQRGQDHRLPYDPNAPLAEQVRQSMASSLQHLETEWVDSYILHGPSSGGGWSAADEEVWRAMRGEQEAGRAHALGVSNVTLPQLKQMSQCGPLPAFVQNRCLARFGWDREVREFCQAENIVYQGFWLLTGNADTLQTPALASIAGVRQVTRSQILFAFARAIGILPLTGTSQAGHMKEDLASLAIELSPDELKLLG